MIDPAETLPIALHDVTPLPIDSDLEYKIDGEITSLWSAHVEGKLTTRHTNLQLKELRRRLGERLSAMKLILVRSGRAGG